MTYCILQTNLLLRSSSQPTTAGKGEAERQKLDRGVDEFKRSSRIQTVLSGLLLQHAGAGEEPLRTCTFIFGITQLVKHNQTSTYFFFFFLRDVLPRWTFPGPCPWPSWTMLWPRPSATGSWSGRWSSLENIQPTREFPPSGLILWTGPRMRVLCSSCTCMHTS